MTPETETKLIKLVEELKVHIEEINKTLSRFIETTNQSLTKIQVTQGVRIQEEQTNESELLKAVEVIIGYVFQISLVFGIPLFGYMIGGKLFPDNQILQHFTFTFGIIFMFFAVSLIPNSPDKGFKDENRHFYKFVKKMRDFVTQSKGVIGVGMFVFSVLGFFIHMIIK